MNRISVRWFLVILAATAATFIATGLALHTDLPRGASLAAMIFTSLVYPVLWLAVHHWLSKRRPSLSNRLSAIPFLAGLLPLFVNLPYMWIQSRSSFEVDIDKLPDAGKVFGEIIIGLTLVAVLLATQLRSGKLPFFRKETSGAPSVLKALVAVCVVYALTGSTLSIIYHNQMQDWSSNTATAFLAISHAFDDRGYMYNSILQSLGSSMLGVHSNYIYFFIYPFFRIFPRYETIVVFSQMWIAGAAIPLFLLARRRLTDGQSLFIALIYLFYPTIAAGVCTQGVSEFSFLPLPFFLSLLFFDTKRFFLFGLTAILAMSTREDVGLLYVILGIFALFQRRRWYWSVIPVAAGIGWFVFSTKVLIPSFNPVGEFTRLQIIYKDYGGTQTGLIKALITRPWLFFTLIAKSPANLGLTYILMQTTLGVSLFSVFAVLAAPGYMENILAETSNINAHHSMIIILPLIAALIFGLVRVTGLAHRRFAVSKTSITNLLVILVLFSTLSTFFYWFIPARYSPRYNYATAQEVLRKLPPDATVILPTYFQILTPYQQDMRAYYQIQYRQDAGMDILQEDIIIVDDRVPGELKDTPQFQGQSDMLAALTDTDEYYQVFEKEDLRVFIRKGMPNPFQQ
ncbi:MAG: DUF2079 domain-containing protein [Thermoleophilia bacterium]